MGDTSADERTSDDLAGRIAERAREAGLTVAVAESLTGGQLAAFLARAEGASDWFRGGVVSYMSEVKFAVLDVPEGPVVSRPAAEQMARGVRDLMGADLAVAVTGAGGPDPQDGQPPGTVWIGTATAERVTAEEHHFDGDPEQICAATCRTALARLVEAVGQEPSRRAG